MGAAGPADHIAGQKHHARHRGGAQFGDLPKPFGFLLVLAGAVVAAAAARLTHRPTFFRSVGWP